MALSRMSTESSPLSSPISGSSFISESSTPIYDHESFDTFSHKAQALLDAQFPNDRLIRVARLSGGSFHRIIGATLKSDQEEERVEVILRIPRFPYIRLADEVAVLRYLANHTAIIVPHVLRYDLSDDNHVESPYMIQTCLRGKSLEGVYPSLSFNKKVNVIRGIASLLKQFSEVNFPIIGMLVAKSPDDASEMKIDQAWDYAEDIFPREDDDPRPSAQSSSIRSFLEERWSFHLQEEERCGPTSRSEIAYITAFRHLTDSLNLPDEHTPARIVLFHTDFAPRNIQVDTGEIMGVLDWDKAESAPVEAAWQIPGWLWDRGGCGSNQLSWVDPDEVPESPEGAKLREVFIEEIGKQLPDFMKVVRKNKILYQILVFARIGLRSMERVEKANEFLKEMKVDIPDLGQQMFN
ncbi:kinase-like domain-containing protein [Cyathus striatus]|nr:kinase-like domain-containing protein [Cyathus striatus]